MKIKYSFVPIPINEISIARLQAMRQIESVSDENDSVHVQISSNPNSFKNTLSLPRDSSIFASVSCSCLVTASR